MSPLRALRVAPSRVLARHGRSHGETFLFWPSKSENLRFRACLARAARVVEVGLHEKIEAGNGELGDRFDDTGLLVGARVCPRGWCG